MKYVAQFRTLAGAAIAFAASAMGAEPLTTPAIAGVVKQGTVVQLVKDGFEGTEGPLPQADGSILFTENRASRIVRVTPDGSTSVWLANTGGANSLALNARGEIIAALTEKPGIGIISQSGATRVLASTFEGQAFGRPNDLVVGRLGQVYFTDPGATPQPGDSVGTPVAVYQLGVDGKVRRIAADILRPNGIALSPDERTLYVANTSGEWVVAFDVDGKGEVGAQRNFAKLAGVQQTDTGPRSGADGLAVDVAGRVYVASSAGVQVFSPQGQALGIIALPNAPQNLAFGGKDRSTLYIVGRGAVYRIETQTKGPGRPGK